jgi:hypothetical protein
MTTSAEPPPARPLQRFPDFFIVGHTKSGTTALYEMLRGHPQIYMPDLKEPQYFASDLRPPHPALRAGEPQTLDGYLSLFDAALPQERVGEASSLYLWSREAAGAIAKVQPAARVIAILREPASFLRSLHLQLLANHVETQKSFRSAISLEQARRHGKRIPRRSARPQALLYSERVRYVEQLRRFHTVFPAEQVLVLIYDDFRADNEGTVREVLRFLAVDDSYQAPAIEANPTLGVRSVRLDALKNALRAGQGPAMRALRGTGQALTTERMRTALYPALRHAAHGEPPPPDEELMLELRRRFKPEVVALSEYLGRDLVTLWGYDAVD